MEHTTHPKQDGAEQANHLNEWASYLSGIKGCLPNTIKLYRRTIEVIWSELGTLDLTQEELEAWLLRKGGSASSFGNRLSALRSYYRWKVRTKQTEVDPTIGIEAPKRRKGIPKPVKDLKAVLAELDLLDHQANTYGNIPRPPGQSREMATFLEETGLRIHEAVALETELPAPETVTLVGKGGKEAIVLLTKKAQDAWNFLDGRWPIGARATQRRFEKAGIHPHQLRHTRATSLVQAGVDIGTVSKILRHSSPTVTMVYAAYATSQLREAMESVEV